MSGAVEVIQPGLLTTLQDDGRIGFQSLGVPVSGVMDPFAFHVANTLVGNETGEAALEITILGPTLLFQADCLVAITGADLAPLLDEHDMPSWQAVAVRKGSVVRFGGRRSGCRAYLAVAGGFAVPQVLGSKSTYLRGGFGGFGGRALRVGDMLPLADHGTRFPPGEGFRLPLGNTPQYEDRAAVRVILGPQEDWFTGEAVDTLLRSDYSVTSTSDRMGYRLDGPRLMQTRRPEIISEGVALGTIQVPADGTPIVLLADRQTVGGYPKIATAISADIPSLAQCFPGLSSIRFVSCSLGEARRELEAQRQVIDRLALLRPGR